MGRAAMVAAVAVVLAVASVVEDFLEAASALAAAVLRGDGKHGIA